MKDYNWCQTLGQFAGVYFSNLDLITYDINDMKFDLNVSTKVKFKTPGPSVYKPG